MDFIPLPNPEKGFMGYAYPGFKQETTVLPKGHVKEAGFRPFRNNVIFDRDVAIAMRDGTILYADIFRPEDSDIEKVPALIPWSPYGKSGSGAQNYDVFGPWRCGVPKETTTGYDKFEAPDPDEWVGRGYAIVNVDARGCNDSEGNIHFWGLQEAEDVHDTIDWLSKQTWCSGSVGMIGNSWLAIAQLNYASRFKHPALKAIAPLEGANDIYRDITLRGGFKYDIALARLVQSTLAGRNKIEDLCTMATKNPLFNDYWADKRFNIENIGDEVAVYFAASYSSRIHSQGSFESFEQAKTRNKWLRVHFNQEWSFSHRPDVKDDLQRFYDRFLKNVDNGWEKDTPPVRLSLLAFEGSSVSTVQERPEQAYPPARQQLRKLYLNAARHSMEPDSISEYSAVSHAGHHLTASSDFTIYFDSYTELSGYPMVRLYMSCTDHDDMDVVVQIRKINSKGELMQSLNYPCPVPLSEVPDTNVVKYIGTENGLRASHAISRSEARSRGHRVYYDHDKRQPIKPGTIVPLEITLWPIGMVIGAGEGIMLRVSGHMMYHPEAEILRVREPVDENKGDHCVHTGGEYSSFLLLPVLPLEG